MSFFDELKRRNVFKVAAAYAWLNEIDKSFEWLERAYEQKDSGITQLSFDPYMASLHTDPRWGKFLIRVGMFDYWKELQTERHTETLSGEASQ